MATRFPNLFIVGAAKSGTTALHTFLAQHPDVYMSPLKEPHHFGSDLALGGLGAVRDDARYRALFAGAAGQSYVGESSVTYLPSRVAASEIHAASPDARIVILLRNPVDAAYALHSQLLYRCQEDLRDFAAAWDNQADRAAGRRLPAHVSDPFLLQYREVFRFPGQVERFISTFGRERVHVALFDDLRDDAGAFYRGVLGFLGVDEDFAPDLGVVNPAMQVRNLRVQAFLQYPPRLLRRARVLSPVAAALRVAQAANVTHRKRAPLPSHVRRRVAAAFAPDIEALEKLLGRDLSAWR